MACRNCGKYPFCDKSNGPKDTCDDEVPRRDKSGEVVERK